MSDFVNPNVLGPPPDRLTNTQIEAWNDIVKYTHKGVLIRADRIHVECAAGLLALVRADLENIDAGMLGILHKYLEQMFMTPADRAKLGIPESNVHFI